MDTRFLDSFVTVVDGGSIAEAARRLNLTPAAVAQRIRALESEIGRNYSNVGVFHQLTLAPQGTFDQVAQRDGVARRYVYSRVGELPS